jgi:hypothetical protein
LEVSKVERVERATCKVEVDLRMFPIDGITAALEVNNLI